MRFYNHFLLSESNNSTALISIDMQPLYAKYIENAMNIEEYIDFLNNFKGPIIIFYNGPDIGGDDAYTIKEWYLEQGLDEDVIDKIIWKEKVYAFFRNWMDNGMERNYLIKAIRYMVMNRINDSREIDRNTWLNIFDGNEEYADMASTEDSINLPDISIGELKKYSGCYLCGGGKDECLSEFRFLLEAFNIRYTLLKDFVY